MRGYIELGSTPSYEKCAQVGTLDYANRAMKECRRYVSVLKRRFQNLPKGMAFKKRSFPHDFGTYFEVVIEYDEEDERQLDATLFIEANLPRTWCDSETFDLGQSSVLECPFCNRMMEEWRLVDAPEGVRICRKCERDFS